MAISKQPAFFEVVRVPKATKAIKNSGQNRQQEMHPPIHDIWWLFSFLFFIPALLLCAVIVLLIIKALFLVTLTTG